MKKKSGIISAFAALCIICIFAFLSFVPVKPGINARMQPKSASTAVFYQSCVQSGTQFVGCCSYASPNASFSISGSTCYFSSMVICYVPGGTPPWGTSTKVGVLSSTYRPASTKVATCTAGAAVFQLTFYSNGDVYCIKTSGTYTGSGVSLSGNYSLSGGA